jgi:hypothetical protein
VAALIVSKFGHKDRHHRGLTLGPRTTERILREAATQTPCPVTALSDYPETNSVDALCEGTIEHNGFYGDGVVNALAASIAPDLRPTGYDPPRRRPGPGGLRGLQNRSPPVERVAPGQAEHPESGF